MEKLRNRRENGFQADRKKGLLRRAASVTACAMVLVLLAGCSRLPWGKPTAVSLAKAAIDNVQKAQSAEVVADIDSEITLNVSAIKLALDLDLGVDLDMEMTRDPMMAKGTADVALGVVGQNQTMKGEFYLDASDGSGGTTYIRWNDGKWVKKTKSAESRADAELKEAQEGGTAVPSSGGNLTETVMQSMGLLKMVADEAAEAELLEETVTINDKEAWQINTTLKGTTVKEILSRTEAARDNPQLAAIDWENVKIPAEIYIYKDVELPARIVLECGDIANALLADALAKELEDFPFGEITASAKSCRVDLTFDRYDEIEPITIPQEVKDAEEAESLMPNGEDLVKGLM